MAIRNKVNKFTKGCKCKKNSCKTKQCGCKQKGQTCGPGCQCFNCENILPTQAPAADTPRTAEEPLYFQDGMEQSLLIEEEIEVRDNSECSDGDPVTDSDTDSDTESDTDDDYVYN